MIQEAEDNASQDKSRRALVNITYELDTLLQKSEVLLTKVKNSVVASDSIDYFNVLISEIKALYKKDKLMEILGNTIEKLKYSYNILLVEYIKNEIGNVQKTKSNPPTDGVIDVDIADEN